jgi:hypothetical protein
LKAPDWSWRAPTFQSTETTTPEKAFIRRVLLDIRSVPFFGRVGVMFMLHQFIDHRYFPLTLSASLTAIGWRHRRHMARHNWILALHVCLTGILRGQEQAVSALRMIDRGTDTVMIRMKFRCRVDMGMMFSCR